MGRLAAPLSLAEMPRTEGGAAPRYAILLSSAFVPVGVWKAPWGAGVLGRESDVVSKELSLLTLPVDVSDHLSQGNTLDDRSHKPDVSAGG